MQVGNPSTAEAAKARLQVHRNAAQPQWLEHDIRNDSSRKVIRYPEHNDFNTGRT